MIPIHRVGGKASTRKDVVLQLHSFQLLPKAHGSFPQKRYALFKRRFSKPFNDPFGGWAR
jgi:hypothetical protein